MTLPPVTAGPEAKLPALVPVVRNEAGELNATLSVDGRWIAYQSNESGRFEIYASPYPDLQSAPREPVSAGGGMAPLFSRDGHELFYLTLNGTLMSVPLRPGGTWRDVAGQPGKVFDAQQYNYGSPANQPFRMYDVSADGKKFLFLKLVQARESIPTTIRMSVILNWTEELRRLVPR